MSMPSIRKLRAGLVSAALRGVQSVAANAANAGRGGPRLWKDHTVSDLLVARRIAAHIEPGNRVLDIGCGDGHWLRRLRLFRDIEAVGVDLAPPPGGPGVTLLTYDGRALPFPDKSFDVAMFGYVLHHVGREHARSLLAEAARVSRRSILLLEDSMPAFGFWYRLRNKCHRLEAELAYSAASDTYLPPQAEEMFLTHGEWRELLASIPGVASVSVEPLADVHRLAHHTLVAADLA